MKRVIAPVLIIVIASCLTGVMIWQKRQPAKKELPENSLLVDALPIESKDIRFMIASQGTVQPRTETTLISEISGVVLEVSPKFIAGGFFKKDEVLLRIDPSDYEVAVEQAHANLTTMKARLTQEIARAEQAKKEWDMSGLSREEAPVMALRTPYLEEARANIRHAEAELKKAERKLQRTVIRVPYDGLVKEKLVDIGQYVSIGTQLGRTFAVDFAEVRLSLTDRDVAYLNLPPHGGFAAEDPEGGPEVDLKSIVGGKSYSWKAHIVRTEAVIDERSRVRYAVARIADPYAVKVRNGRPALAIGSFVTASIYGKKAKDIVAIPRTAVHGDNTIYIMDEEGRLRIQKIDVVRTDQDLVYATNGFGKNQWIITSAIEVPVAGMKVRLANDN